MTDASSSTPTPPARPGLVGLLAAIGSGLLGAAVGISAMRSRDGGDPMEAATAATEGATTDPSTTLDWSNYAVGLGATAALLLIAAAAVVLRRGRGRVELATWPGVVGILGAAAMLDVGLRETDGVDDVLGYLTGALILALAVVGYLAVRRGAFVVTAILGLAILYTEAFVDIFDGLDEDNAVVVIGLAVGVFVVAVTAVGWLLPTRALSGVVVGVVAVVAYGSLLTWVVVARFLGDFFGALGGGMPGEDGELPDSGPFGDGAQSYDNDVWTILAFAAVLTLLWAAAAAVTGHPGFSILAIAMPAVTVPIATAALAVEHPTWWGVALAGAGSFLLVVGGLRQLLSRRKESPAT